MTEFIKMFDLSPYNTFGLHVHAKSGLFIRKLHDLQNVDPSNSIIIGHGSDVLFTDDYEGTALINSITHLKIEKKGDDYEVTAGGGLVLDDLISELLSKGICGLENLSAIPGTVGAAPVQNIGAYGVEIGALIKSVQCYDLLSRKEISLGRDECEFGYRTSYFKQHPERRLFITSVTFLLHSVFSPVLRYKGLEGEDLKDAWAVRDRVIKLRREKLPDPKKIGNAGSFFKNPVVEKKIVDDIKSKYTDVPVYETNEGKYKLASGWLIDKAGCKGIIHGNVGTWQKQALVIVNYGNAKPHEIVSLARYIQSEVENKFAVNIEPEVRIYVRTGEISWQDL